MSVEASPRKIRVSDILQEETMRNTYPWSQRDGRGRRKSRHRQLLCAKSSRSRGCRHRFAHGRSLSFRLHIVVLHLLRRRLFTYEIRVVTPYRVKASPKPSYFSLLRESFTAELAHQPEQVARLRLGY